MKVGALIARERERQGLTQRDLSRKIGIQHSHLSELETGVRPYPAWHRIVKLAKALNINLNDLAEQCDEGQ